MVVTVVVGGIMLMILSIKKMALLEKTVMEKEIGIIVELKSIALLNKSLKEYCD